MDPGARHARGAAGASPTSASSTRSAGRWRAAAQATCARSPACSASATAQLADGEFNHTSALVLLDADGRILARTEQVGSRPDPEFLAAVRKATAQ